MTRESKSAVLFRHWLRANPQSSGSYEMKDSRGKYSISFSEFKDHQLNYGLAIKRDRGAFIRVIGSNGEPDYVYLRNSPAWVVVRFPESFEIIDVEDLMLEKDRGIMKSLSHERARAIAKVSIPLKSK